MISTFLQLAKNDMGKLQQRHKKISSVGELKKGYEAVHGDAMENGNRGTMHRVVPGLVRFISQNREPIIALASAQNQREKDHRIILQDCVTGTLLQSAGVFPSREPTWPHPPG